MTVLNENLQRPGCYIIREANGYRSRERAVLASGSGKVMPGLVVGFVDADKKFKPLDPDGSDGSQIAAGILFQGCDATDQDVRRTFSVRDTEVHLGLLIWPEGISDVAKTSAISELEQLGLITR